MFKKIFVAVLVGALLSAVILTQTPTIRAQGTSAEDQLQAILSDTGLVVSFAGDMMDANGNEDASHVYVIMPYESEAPNVKFARLSSDPQAFQNSLYAHTILAYRAMRQVFPSARTMSVVVIDGWISATFTADTATFDASELSGASVAVFKTNQLAAVRYLNLVDAQPPTQSKTTSGNTNTQAGSSTYHPNPTPTPVTADSTEPCDYFGRTPSAGNVLFYVRNQYTNHDLTFTIGGQPWGTHDYKITGDSIWYYFEIPPGDYTWTATVNGIGAAGSGPRASYAADLCYSEDFRN